MKKAIVQVGTVMEITSQEGQELMRCGDDMRHLALNGRKGWLLSYMRAHKEAMKILQTIVRRSHAN